MELNPSPASTQIGQAIEFIEMNCHQAIKLKDVAAHIHLSPNHLANKMKKSTGCTVGHWISKHRLRKACDFLQTTDLSIEQIAEQLDWTDLTNFIRQFKKQYQLTPAAWRRKQRESN